MAGVDVVYYLDVLSSWCYIADRALEAIEAAYGDCVRVDWRIAQLADFGPLPYPREELEWYYARAARMTGVHFNAAWMQADAATTVFANQAAQAVHALGDRTSRVRRALSAAALLHGKPMGRREIALEESARASGFPASAIDAMMDAPQVKEQIVRTTREFKDLALPQLPAFVFRNTSGDAAVFSGLYTYASFDAVIAEMLHASRVTEEMGAEPWLRSGARRSPV